MIRLIASLLLSLLPALATADCSGTNLFPALSPVDRAAIRQATDSVPFARGLLWRATRGGDTITLVGTYHFDDPRHAALMARLTPLLDTAKTLLVEAGPAEEAALKSDLAKNPALVVQQSGPTLPESLPPEDWAHLSAALKARGVPPFLAAKLRPWYVTTLLAVPPCAMTDAAALAAGGLDQRLMARATERGLPVIGLEPHDTVFKLFDAIPQADQLAMIRQSLATEAQSADYSATLADSYFAEDARLIWEISRHAALSMPDYTPEQVARDFATIEAALMTNRNRAWITVLEQAAATGPAFAAFGALHLSGETGILNLLQNRGFTLERLPL